MLLTNDGKGGFTVVDGAFEGAEPKLRALLALDPDGDGDLDLLLGGVDVLTRLWLNQGGHCASSTRARACRRPDCGSPRLPPWTPTATVTSTSWSATSPTAPPCS